MNSDKKEIALIVCPHCKQKVPKTKWCITCGGEIVSTLINDTQQETVRIKCHSCQENVPALPFCVHCGKALNKPVEPKQKLCPLCRQEIPVSDHAFCHLCGAQLKTSVQTSSETSVVICNHCWKPNPPNTGYCIHCAKLLSRKPRKTVLLEEPFEGYQLELSQLLKPTTVPLSIIKQKTTSNFPTKSTILHSPYFGVVVKSRQTLSFLDKNFGGFNRENIMNYAGSFVIVLMLYFYWYSEYYSTLNTFETILSGVDPTINAIIVFIAGIILTSLLMMPLWLATFFVYRKNGYYLNYRLDTSRVLITMIFNFIWILFSGGGPIILRIGDIRKTEDRAIKNSSFVKGITMGSIITIVFTLFLTAITVLTFGSLGTFSGLVLHDHILKVHVAATFFGGTWISLMLILPLGDFYDRMMKQYNMVLYFVMFIIAILMLLYSSEVTSVIDPKF
ncbi:MAG: zinc ribbon domain-containing protein [Candidatus Heimdallarchaeota archaeon]|nr:zinc ribbon domain-containing protein [Candidatus Heimdallarchaeota archaeon]